MCPPPTAADPAHGPEERQILDYVGAMSLELSELAERAGYAALAGDLRRCSREAEDAGDQART